MKAGNSQSSVGCTSNLNAVSGGMKRVILIGLMVLFLAFQADPAPCGAVLIRDGQHLSYCNVPKDMSDEAYFGRELEGVAWENKHSFYRHYIVPDGRNTIDIAGKKIYDAILPYADYPSFMLHQDNDWGADILLCGSTLGLGCFNLYSDGNWISPPAIDGFDSVVVTIPDSSQATPVIKIIHYGWVVKGNKLNVAWTISTKWDDWATNCEMQIDGTFDGMVVVGIRNQLPEAIRDTANALLATIGEQGGIVETLTDTLLMAVKTESQYLGGYVDDGTHYGILLQPDGDGKVAWSLGYSWAGEPDPIFRDPDWKNKMFENGSTGYTPPMVMSAEPEISVQPNPINPSACISYYLPQNAAVSLVLYNMQGKIVKNLAAGGMVSAGRHTVRIESHGLVSGIYICEFKSGAMAKRLKLVLMR